VIANESELKELKHELRKLERYINYLDGKLWQEGLTHMSIEEFMESRA
jgi:hypothetical protein